MGQLGFEKFKKLNRVFESRFFTAFDKIKNESKNDIFRYFDNIYRIWYYSALFREGFASPAIFADMWFEDEGVTTCVPNAKDGGLDFEWKKYTVEEHPFVADLFTVVDIVEDNASFDRISHELIPEDHEKYAGRFALHDSAYISYLIEISLELGIIKKIPSIYIMKYRATAKGLHLDQLDSRSIIEKVTECAAKICCRKFMTIFGNEPALNKAMVIHWLKEVDITDKIYEELYDIVGVDIISLWKNERDKGEELDEVDKAALAAVYPIGRMIDRYFLTPFGRYLQLIQPVYYNPFNIERELRYIFDDGMRNDFDDSLAVFCPSSLFKLTNLGKKLISDSKKETPFVLNETEMEGYLAKLMAFYAEDIK